MNEENSGQYEDNIIYVPDKTFPKELEDSFKIEYCSPLQLSIRLENCKYKTDFILDLRKNNFDFKHYNVIVETKGAENIYDVFAQMTQTSSILLISCVIISVLIFFFIVFLFISKRKTEMAVMTALGTKKRYITVGFLCSVLAIVLIGTIIGIIIGTNLGCEVINSSYERLRNEISSSAQYASRYSMEFVFNNFHTMTSVPIYIPIFIFVYNIFMSLCMALIAIRSNLRKEPIVLLTAKEN